MIAYSARTRSLGIACAFLCASAFASAATYYVDSSATGNDSNNGTSTTTPWKSLTKVNGTTFAAGDVIRFKSGGVWNGQLWPKGSGSSGSPITINAYNTGAAPIINGGGVLSGAVKLSNQEYWEINDLEITNNNGVDANADRRGVEVTASNFGTVDHIYLRNLHIHDVRGIISGSDNNAKRTGGIYIATLADNTTATRFNDVLVEDCIIHDVSNQGIVTNNEDGLGYPGDASWTPRRLTNLVIRGNTIYNVSKNAMILRLADGGTVEYNLCHDTALGITGNTIFTRSSRNLVLQFNEGYRNLSPDYDGSLYDPDLQSPGMTFQYSYSHDNSHGLIWYCTEAADTGITVRYNISQNDLGRLVYLNYDIGSTDIYNNVFYIGAGLDPKIISTNTGNSHTYTYRNNIVYNAGTAGSYSFKTSDTKTIAYNLFYGSHPASEPADAHKLTSDPKFAAPGTGGIGIDTVDGYKLLTGSPAIGSGTLISSNGGRDYWGNSVSSSAVPNRGVFSGTPTASLVLDREAEVLTVDDSSGDAVTTNSDAAASAGKWVNLAADAVGDYVTFSGHVPAGTYQIQVRVKKYNSRGIMQLATSGSASGPFYDKDSPKDLYNAGGTAVWSTLTWTDQVTFPSSGVKYFRFTVTGKNAASSGYSLGLDELILTKQ